MDLAAPPHPQEEQLHLHSASEQHLLPDSDDLHAPLQEQLFSSQVQLMQVNVESV